MRRIDFGAINKQDALTNWIADIWFPQALIEADAATILTGFVAELVARNATERNVYLIASKIGLDQ